MSKKIQSKKIVFNLLKPVQQPKTSWDKIYDWLVDKARIILFIVEILIAVAFIGKFVVDTQAKSKEKEIETLKQQENFYASDKEPAFRLIQNRNRNYITLWNDSSNYYSILSEVYSYISKESEDLNISISADKVTVSGYEDIEELQKVEESFKKSNTFFDADIQVTFESDDIVAEKGRYTLVGYINPEKINREDLN